jgi:hypothetical protein
MTLKNLEPPSEYASYDIRRQKTPEKIRYEALLHVSHLSDIIRSEVLGVSTVQEVLCLPFGRGWGYKSAEQGVNLLVYGTFRSEYKIIMTMAEILADYYAQTLFSPIIVPIRQRIWSDYLYHKDEMVSLLSRQGMISYSVLHG